jgi:hypothetical protein
MDVLGLDERYVTCPLHTHASVPAAADAALEPNPHIIDSQVQRTNPSRQRPRVLRGSTIRRGLIYIRVKRVQSPPNLSVRSLTSRVASPRITRGFVIKTKTRTTSFKENGD